MGTHNDRIRLGIVGLGKIAVDQHIPAIGRLDAFELVAAADRRPSNGPVPVYGDMAAMLAAHPDIRAVSLCTPPQVRFDLACDAISRGLHVFLEKPPAMTMGQARTLDALSKSSGGSIFTAWHSRFSPAVARAAGWVADHAIKTVNIAWKENVRKWHPGQTWIFEAGGMGVFDPGINGLSILTAIVPGTLLVDQAVLHVPENVKAPIQAELEMHAAGGARIYAEFDFLQEHGETWSIDIWAHDGGRLRLENGGALLSIDGAPVPMAPEAEYLGLYTRFLDLIRMGRSELDFEPLRIVADAMLVGDQRSVAAYYE